MDILFLGVTRMEVRSRFRVERDFLGEKQVPSMHTTVYKQYGRSKISPLQVTEWIRIYTAIAIVKKSAAHANKATGQLEK